MPFKKAFKCRDAGMAELFGHEKLIVYQKGMRFAIVRSTLLAGLPKRVAACDHLERGVERMLAEFTCSSDLLSKLDKATTAIPLNIAEGSGRFSGTDQAKFFGIAYKAAIQSSALVDLAAVSASAVPSRVNEGQELLRRIAAMLTSLSKVASDEK